MHRIIRLGMFVLAVAVALPLMAQEGGRRGFRGGFGMQGPSALDLLGSQQVQDEIKLVDEQKQKIDKIREEVNEQRQRAFGGLRDLSDEERRERIAKMREESEAREKETQKAINEVLLDDQQKRLKEILVQARGASALQDAEVASELKLTDDQKKTLATIREENQRKMMELFQGGDREQAREKGQALRREVEEKSLAVLTSEQKSQFEKMQGKKIELDRSQFRGRGGFGGGRGGAGGRRGGNN